MRLTMIFSFCFVFTVLGNSYSQNTKLNLHFSNVELREVIDFVEQNSEFIFLYKNEDVDVTKKVNVILEKANIERVLEEILAGQDVNYTVFDRQIILTRENGLYNLTGGKQEEKIISGIVTDDTGSPVPGVTVMVKGTTIGTITDFDGKYQIKVPVNGKILVFSFVGMKAQEVTTDGVTNLNVIMNPETLGIEEVVVTALGIKRETRAIGFSAQEVGSKDLSGNRELSVANMLTGKVAGLQISRNSSGTGGSTSISLRGVKSLKGNNQPLIVVDGVPISNRGHDSGGTWNDTDTGDGIGDINSEDVENVSVLKGPGATALYGSKGANGVLLITTKSGQKKKGISVEVNSNLSIETLNLVPTFQNQYATGYEETNLSGLLKIIDGKSYETMKTSRTDSWGPPLDGRRTIVDPFVYPEDEFKKTLVLLPQPADNVKKFYDTGITNSNTISLSGGNDKTTTRLSLGNSYTKGIMPNNTLSKQTITLRTSSQITDYLSFDVKLNYVHDDGSNRPSLGAGNDNVTTTLVTMGRYVPMSWLKEYYEKTKKPGSWPGVNCNPYFTVNELKNHDTKDRLIGMASATLKINSWLSLLGRAGTDFYSQRQDKIWPIDSKGSDNIYGRVYNYSGTVRDVNADVLLMANKQLSKKFNVSGTLGSSILYQERKSLELDARKLKAPGVYDVSNCTDIRPSTLSSKKEMQSVFFTGQVVYNNYLYLDVTGRNDWSSALGLNNQSFFYPSVSSSFVFSDAFKFNPDGILTFGKVRASWAQVGNDSDPYKTMNGYNSTTTTYGGVGLSSMNSQIPLLNLENELTESWEVGTNLKFLNNRIGLDVTYYNGKTTNQILEATLPVASGYSTIVMNAGEIQNKGLEIMLNLNPVKTNSGFSWDIAANFALNQSKVVSLRPGLDAYLNPNGKTEVRVGNAFGNIVGYAFKKAPDGQRIVSANGAYLPEASKTTLGNTTPDWTGGLNNTFSYKGFTLNVLLDFVQGNEIYSTTKYQMEAKGTGSWTVEGRRPRDTDDNGVQLPEVGVLAGVVEVTDAGGNVTYVKNTKAVNGQTYWANRAWSEIGEEFVIDGSYISLREVMLSYSFKPSLLKKTPFAGITLSAIGRNLLYLEEHMQKMGVSPESNPNTSASDAGIESIAMPSTRTWGFNVKLTF